MYDRRYLDESVRVNSSVKRIDSVMMHGLDSFMYMYIYADEGEQLE